MNYFIFSLFILATPLLLQANNEILVKKAGTLFFFENEYILKFDLDLDSYYLNAKMLQNNTILLQEKCNENPHLTDCKFFHNKFREIAEYAIRETKFLQLNREKRAIICLTIAFIATTITAAIIGFIAGAAVVASGQKTLAEQHNIQQNMSINQLKYDENNLYLQNRSTHAIFEEIDSIRNNFTDAHYINQIMTATLIAIDKHNRDTEKFLNALSNDLKEKFFTIIDIPTFNETLSKIKLTEKSPLFTLNPKEIIELSSLESELINNTISISIHMPRLTDKGLDLLYLMPIPITHDNNDFILNFNAKHLIQNESMIAEMPLAILAQCSQTPSIIICNSLLSDQILPIDNCINAIMTNTSTTAICTYKNLKHQNALMKTSDKSVYAHIIQPILLKISCGRLFKIINVTRSGEIFYEKHCNIFNLTNTRNHDTFRTTVKIASDYSEPKFEIFENQTWTKNLNFLNQYNNEINHLFREFKQNEREFIQRSKAIDISTLDFLSLLSGSWWDNIIIYLALYIVLPICLFILIICCICRITK